jgi:hypothetical protein
MKVFNESQKFNQPLIYIGLGIGFVVIAISTFKSWNAIENSGFWDKFAALSGIFILLLVIILFLILKLKTKLDEFGIHYQFVPFHLKPKLISWTDIKTCTIRQYDPISEFGGWGIRSSFKKNIGKAYTTKGTIGLQVDLKNGKKILFGTQKREHLQRALDTYKTKITVNKT